MSAMATSHRCRNLNNLRSGRSQRKRYDSEDENIALDWDKPVNENLQEILLNITRRDGVPKGHRLAYLNCFTKLCTKLETISQEVCGLTIDEIFCCIRVALFHEAGEVRAAGLRAMRYLLKDAESVDAVNRVNLPLLICRSIDIVLDNRLERIQALRLVRQLLTLNPKQFPPAITRCLVAIAKDGSQERDMLVRACWATVAEMTVLNPTISHSSGGLSAIIKSVLQSNQTHSISESLVSSILFLLNSPKTRHLIRSDVDLQHFVAPFTDVHGFGGEYCESYEQKTLRYAASKNAVLSILKSWPGLVYMCRVSSHYSMILSAFANNRNILGLESGCDAPNGTEALINMLHLPYTDIQRYIIEMIFELFNLRIPEWTDDFEAALISSDVSAMRDSWHLYDGFVAAEGKAILPFIGKNRINLLNNYLALALHSFINYGLIEALVSVILNSVENSCSVTATILLGELLYLSSCFLPSDCSHRCQSLPTLMTASMSSSPKEREIANASISNLNRIHELKKRRPVPCSLYLDQLLQFCQPLTTQSHTNKLTKSKMRSHLKKNADDAIIQMIKNSQVLRREYNNWDWDLIDCILRWPGDALKKLEDTNHHKAFVKRLLYFYKPSTKQFSSVSNSDERERIMCVVGQHFLDFLLEADDSKAHEYIEEFFIDLDACFSQITVEMPPQTVILSPGRLLSTLSHSYFLFIGRLTNSNKGKKWLEKTGVYQYFLDLISLSAHDVYMKLIVSSLDYSSEVNNFSRTLLNKVLTSVSESARVYATNYLRVLLRAGVCDFSKWAIDMLVMQLYDKSTAVSLAAIDVLQEACDATENLEALISLRPSLLHLGDNGLLLLIRYLSLPSGFKFLRDANFIDFELSRWQKTFNFKYVRVVEDVLYETFTCHHRSEDGTYGRRSDKRTTTQKSPLIPPHLYGQLAQTSDGYELLLKEDCLSVHYQVIRAADLTTEMGIIRLKAALWAVGHVGATHLGFQLISESEMIPIIVRMAAQSPVLSVRGTCFNVLCLLASTSEGSDVLQEYGWESIRHSHHEKFCLVDEPKSDSLVNFMSRTHAWSVSTASNKLDMLSGIGDFDGTPSEKLVHFDFGPNEQSFSGSLPSLTVEGSDDLRRKKISLPAKPLPRVMSLSPHHYRQVIDSRPRSSSDTPNVTQNSHQRENTLDSEGSESGSGIWFHQKTNETAIQSAVSVSDIDSSGSIIKPERHDSGLIADATTPIIVTTSGRSNTLLVHETPKRKISEPLSSYIAQTIGRDERSDSNESSHNSSGKSRSGSLAESTSGVSASSYDSSSQTLTHSQRQRNNLSPIASLSSINTSTQSSAVKSLTTPLTSNTLPRIGSKIFAANQIEVLTASESIPSAIDAHGYATLRAIQKRRVQSLSAASYEERRSSEETEDGIRERAGSIIERKSSRFSSDCRSDSSETEARMYMGLCLPRTLFLLFEVNSDIKPYRKSSMRCQSSEWKTHLDRMTNEQIVYNNGLEFHSDSNCLVCFRNNSYSELIISHNMSNNNQLKSPMSETFNIPNQVLNRREILRFVTNLGGAVHAKQAEQGLLNLKQKCPQAFEDICLYTEVSLQLSTYNFRMSARRFLQELFLDVHFDQIYSEAEAIVRRMCVSSTQPNHSNHINTSAKPENTLS